MNLRMLGALSALVAIPALPAQEQRSDSLLYRLIGRWELQGPMAGKPVIHDVTCRWVLGLEYVEMHELSRARRADGSPEYEAIVYLGRDPRTKEYAALWLDNTAYGAFDPAGTGHGKADGDSISFLFTSSPTSHVYNTFKYDRSSNTWEWHIDNEDGHVRTMFARVKLTRE